MENELQPLLRELCYIVTIRNEINSRRHRARFRKNYYANAVRVLEAHNESNSELRKLSPDRHQARITEIKMKMSFLRQRYPKPDKWKKMGILRLRSLMLKASGDNALAKHEIMELSIKYRKRLAFITKKLNCCLKYNNGSVNVISFDDYSSPLTEDKISQYAVQYELNSAVDNILRG